MIIIWFLICDTFTLYHFSCFILKYIVLMFFVLLDKLVIISSTDKKWTQQIKIQAYYENISYQNV